MICAVGLVIGIVLAAVGQGSWAAPLIIGAVMTPLGTAYYVRKDGGKLRWTWSTSGPARVEVRNHPGDTAQTVRHYNSWTTFPHWWHQCELDHIQSPRLMM